MSRLPDAWRRHYRLRMELGGVTLSARQPPGGLGG